MDLDCSDTFPQESAEKDQDETGAAPLQKMRKQKGEFFTDKSQDQKCRKPVPLNQMAKITEIEDFKPDISENRKKTNEISLITLGYFPVNQELEYHWADQQYRIIINKANIKMPQDNHKEIVDRSIERIQTAIPLIINVVESYAVQRLQGWWRCSQLSRKLLTPDLSPTQNNDSTISDRRSLKR